MAKILLAHPLFLSKSPDERAANSPYFPLGLLYLAAYVREQEHQVALFDGTFQEDETAFAQALQDEAPDIVGITALLPTRDMALTLAQMAHASGHIVVLGGPDPTKDPASYLSASHVDIVVHHEGEQTLATLLDLFDAGRLATDALKDQAGVAFRSEGKVIVNEPRPPLENLDELPMPARDLIDVHKYLTQWKETNGYSSLNIVTSRGCPYNCDWCRDAVHGNDYRQRSPENVAEEMKLLNESFEIDRLRVVDDVDGIERAWLESWATAVEEKDAAIPFEALNDLQRKDIPLLDVRDSL